MYRFPGYLFAKPGPARGEAGASARAGRWFRSTSWDGGSDLLVGTVGLGLSRLGRWLWSQPTETVDPISGSGL
jgi:hypothetical protein